MARIFVVEQSALSVGGHYHAYSQCVALAARRAGLDVTILQNRNFDASWGVEDATVIPAFHHTWGQAEQLWIDEWVPGNIAYNYHMAVADAPPGQDDHVLFATLGYAELRNVLKYLISLPIGSQMPYFHVLLRYDPEVLQQNLEVYGPLFRQVARSAQLRRKVLLHADTDRLSDTFAWLSGLPFTTLPIPFQQEHLKQDLAKRTTRDGPLVVTYLGDARLEKGFNALPGLVASLWKDYVSQGKVRFVLQSNFNTEGGEPGILAAVQKLGQYPTSAVELLEKPLATAEYYQRLAQADIVLVPYDAQRYRARSSGILIEAMAAGKPVLTTKRSWMESQVTPEHAVIFDEEGGIEQALKTLIDNYPDYKRAADGLSDRWMQWSSGDNFIQALLSASSARTKRDMRGAPCILFIMDGDALVLRNGAGLLGLTQLRYLDDAGYAVTAIFLTNQRDPAIADIEHWTEILKERVAEFDLDGVFVAGTGRLSMNISRQSALRNAEVYTIAGDMDRVRAYDVSLELVAHIAERTFDAAFLNYVFNAPLLEMLGLGDVPVICETVDIQSFQKAIYGRRRIERRDLELELKLLADCSHIISISADETEFLTSHLPDAAITTIGIFPDLPPQGARSLAGTKSLAEVVSSCGPALPQYQWGTSWKTGQVGEIHRLIGMQSLDLVYVSSSHLANVSGLRWFLDEIYLPHLAPAGVSMIVAGSIREAFAWPQHEKLTFVGRLERLEPLYAAARLVVLPVLEGAGAAVKTAEALNTCRAIVATPIAFRGLEDKVDGVELASTPQEFITTIRRLLSATADRREHGLAVQRSAAKLRDPQRYARLMNGVFRSVLGDCARDLVRDSSGDPDLGDYWEWDLLIEHVNRVVRSWLANEPIEINWLTILANYPEAEFEKTLRVVLHALIDTQSAPILSTDSTLLEVVTRHGRQASEALFDFASEAVSAYRSPGINPGPDLSLIFNPCFPTEIRARASSSGAASPITVLRNGEPALVLREGRDGWMQAGLGADAKGKQSCLARIVTGSGTTDVSVRQTILLTAAFDAVGLPVLSVGDAKATRDLKIGMSGTLHLPRLVGAAASGRWLDFVLGDGSTLDLVVMVEGTKLSPRRMRHEGRVVFRYALPLLGMEGPLSQFTAEFTCTAGTGALLEAAQTITFGSVPGHGEHSEVEQSAVTVVRTAYFTGQAEAGQPSLTLPTVREVVFGKWVSGRMKRDRVRMLTRRGDAARDMHDWLAAQQAYEAVIKESPKLSHIWVQLGHALKERGLVSEALAAYSAADGLQPGKADTLHQIARIQDRLGQHDAALASYDRALALEPSRHDALQEVRDLRQRIQSSDR